MIGDQTDLLSRIKSALPPWFGSTTPNLDTVMSGPANVLSAIYGLIQYSQLQTRIQTSTDGWLDLTAQDFFGRGLPRRVNEPDASYSARILAEIIRPRVTRPAVSRALTDLTGIAPGIFEPARIADTGALGVLSPPTFAFGGAGNMVAVPTLNFGVGIEMVFPIAEISGAVGSGVPPFAGIGAWGSLNYPDQVFITAYRPPGAGVPNVAGFSSARSSSASFSFGVGMTLAFALTSSIPAGPPSTGGGGYGSGSLEYVNQSNIAGPITDAEIYATVARNIAAGVTAWTKITAFNGTTPANLMSWIPVTIDSDELVADTQADQSIAFVKSTPF